ncbi:Uroporphyrinogen-III decarboxylase [Caldanaerobius fijiensis DSM 17918]|uniref:Uroporphyrinogen-III decarboxylase n=1 Tax=Caldanaerobius fijiensis DSM 17918 TaxID=1121256 RepID=A0A1M4ZZR4_9THEO|nr:uroporphyrinogen decarboxylase family protein [Caldanaerobius fijiensis]SHF23540.1 Uroporphyrinogen-III decarboxylase [Caldanaerobius fijiensis DSM 17918]
MKEMTKRERVLRTINFQETDRIPVYDIIDNDNIREYIGGEKITEENAWRLEYAAIRELLDMTRMIVVPNFHPGYSANEDGFVYYNDRYTSWIEKRPFDDVEGLKKWVEKDIDRKNRWQPDEAYVKSYRERIIKHMRGIGDDTVIVVESDVGLDYARSMAGIELFSYLMADEPDLVSEWLEALNQAEIRRAKAIADPELVPIVLTYTDLAYKSGPIFPPAFLKKEFFPRLKRLNDTYHDAGVKCLFHSDGNLMPIMDDLVDAGIDGINPMETVAGMSIKEVRQRYGDKLFITGGIDVSQLMAFGTVEEVREACINAIEEAGGVGYFLGSTTELHPNIPAENIMAMVEVARTYKKR